MTKRTRSGFGKGCITCCYDVTTHHVTKVEWNERKADANVRKHGVTFEEAVTALMDPHAVTFVDETLSDEERDITLGHSARNRLLIVVHTERRAGVLRVISARRATPKERRVYEEGI